ncbi:hypothetical protein BH24ACT3_BH24ACT3_19770 [soil metagenome]
MATFRPMNRLSVPPFALAFAFAVALGTASCGSDGNGAGEAASCATVAQGEVTILAEDIAWDPRCIEAPAGEPFTVVIDNVDDGIAHNIDVADIPEPNRTELENGPVTQTLDMQVDDPGEYEFICDIHPNMTGTLIVE